MQQCLQTKGVSVYRHGEMVRDRTIELITYLDSGLRPEHWVLPDWLEARRAELKAALLPLVLIEEYTLYHDCGKPYCQPADGKLFPDHAQRSHDVWLQAGGNPVVADLMLRDMWIHTMKACDVDAFASHSGAATLLIVGLAELHANAAMFGGTDSTSFKIKWKQIDRRGRAVCRRLWP